MARVKRYSHFIAIDFGTAGCGIAIKSADERISQDIYIFQQWLPSKHLIKCPTIMLLDHKLNCVAFGLSARMNYYGKLVKKSNETENFYLFEYFKMSLYKNKV